MHPFLEDPDNARAFAHLLAVPTGTVRTWASALGWSAGRMQRFLASLSRYRVAEIRTCRHHSAFKPLPPSEWLPGVKPRGRRWRPRRRSVSLRVRYQVLKRDGFCCVYCGKSAKDAELDVDHRVPVAAGGTDDMDNLATACTDCNNGKGAAV